MLLDVFDVCFGVMIGVVCFVVVVLVVGMFVMVKG